MLNLIFTMGFIVIPGALLYFDHWIAFAIYWACVLLYVRRISTT